MRKSKTSKFRPRVQDFPPDTFQEEEQIAGAQSLEQNEKAVDAQPLEQDVIEEYREPSAEQLQQDPANQTNWSRENDRGEDLINQSDAFVQQPERDTEVPAELIQERAYLLYKERGAQPGNDLVDWFDAERQLKQEFRSKTVDQP